MTEAESSEKTVHSEDAWAKPVSKLTVDEAPAEATNLNVDGKQVVGPLQGFGQLWQKTYKVRISDGSGAAANAGSVSPTEVVKIWKQKLPEFMPDNSRFYPSLTGVSPGEVVLINATLPGIPGGMPVSTGVMILYADDESFTVMTPEGHPESGFNTFSAYEEDGTTVAQIQSLARANDPVFELGFRYMGGSTQQEKIWHHVLGQLAADFGSSEQIQMEKKCVDSRIQWSQAKNVWHNAVIRTTLNTPVRWAKRIVKR